MVSQFALENNHLYFSKGIFIEIFLYVQVPELWKLEMDLILLVNHCYGGKSPPKQSSLVAAIQGPSCSVGDGDVCGSTSVWAAVCDFIHGTGRVLYQF